MENGWISIHRRLLSWEWWEDANTTRLFLYLLLSANHTEKKWRGVTCRRGQVITSLSTIKQQTGLSIQQIRTCFDRLKSTGELTVESTSKYSMITVNKYEDYQIKVTSKSTRNATNEQQTSNKRATTTNNDNKENNDNNIKENIKRNRLPKTDELSEEDFEYISLKYKVPLAFVKNKWDDLYGYCHSKNVKYADFKLTLMGFVKRDALKIIEREKEKQRAKSKIVFIPRG